MSESKCVELPCGRLAKVPDYDVPFIGTAADACINWCPIGSNCRDCEAYNMAREAEEEPAPTHEERITTLEETVKRLEESIRKTAMQSYINSGEYEP